MMKRIYIALALVALVAAHVATTHAQEATQGTLNPFRLYGVGNNIIAPRVTSNTVVVGGSATSTTSTLQVVAGTFTIKTLASCDTVDTNASGTLICGTDATGAGAVGTVTTSSAVSTLNVPYWATVGGGLNGTSTATFSSDLSIFNVSSSIKQNGIFVLIDAKGLSPISVSTSTGIVTIQVATATASTNGILTSADWTTFSNKASSSIPFVTIGNTADGSAERAITGGVTVSVTDNGANSTVVIDTRQALNTTSSPTFVSSTWSGLTAGSVMFGGTGGALNQNNANFFWDNTNNRLGIGTSSPLFALSVAGTSPQSTTSSLVLWGSQAIVSGNASGTYMGLNATTTYNGDLINFQVGGVAKFRVASSGLVTFGVPVPVTSGGTGLASVAQGDIFYGSASNVISALAKDTNATRYLSNTGSSNNPAWTQVNVANGITGTVPQANGGTNQTSYVNGGIVYQDTGALQTSSSLVYATTTKTLNLYGIASSTETRTPSSTVSGVATINEARITSSTLSGNPTHSGLTASRLIGTDANKAEQSVSAGTGLSLSGTTLSNTRASTSVQFAFYDATSTSPYKFQQIRVPFNATAAIFHCFETAAATTTLSIYRVDTNGATAASAHIISSITCGNAGTSTTSFTTSTIPAGTWIEAVATSTAGTPTWTSASLELQRTD